MAADTNIVFELGADGDAEHKENSTSKTGYTETVDNYDLSITNGDKMYLNCIDAKGNGCIKLGSSKAVGSFTINVPATLDKMVIMRLYNTGNVNVKALVIRPVAE